MLHRLLLLARFSATALFFLKLSLPLFEGLGDTLGHLGARNGDALAVLDLVEGVAGVAVGPLEIVMALVALVCQLLAAEIAEVCALQAE